MISRFRALLYCLLVAVFAPATWAQSGVAALSAIVTTQGLRSTNHQGSFTGAVRLPDDTLVLLYDQGDGLRLIKADRNIQSDLAEAHLGAAGDTGAAITTDPAGNIYVAGTSTSGALTGTSGAAFPSAVDASSNPFIARFDPELHLAFLTFLGAGRTGIAGIAATADAVFVTGSTYSSSFPVTPGTLETSAPANLASGAGYLASFTNNSGALRYSTFLDGLTGGTTPNAIVADTRDNTYVAGSTSDATFPTLTALQPLIFGPTSGFLSSFSSNGQNLLFSTFVPGSGLTSLALDQATNSLLLTGNIAPGQFPVEHASTPIATIGYQTFLRLSTDGQSVLDSVLLAPGTVSYVTAGPNGTAWISGALSTPLGPAWQDRGPGDGFLLHLSAQDQVDQTLRLGGSPSDNATYSTLSTTLGAPVLSADGALLTVPGTVEATTSPSLLSTQTFDLPLASGPSTFLPNGVQDLLPATCPNNAACSGSAGLLTQVQLSATQTSPSRATGTSSLTIDTAELDFGIVPAAASPASRTVTITNPTAVTQTFASAPDDVPSRAPYAFAELATTCAGPPTAHALPAGATCMITIGLSASSQPQNGGPVHAFWRFGSYEIPITGSIQGLALSVSSTQVEFGPQSTGTAGRLPRILYLSNSGPTPVPHTPVSLAANSPFAVLDGCPTSLAAGDTCSLIFTYNPRNQPTFDSATLTLDQGISVLLTGESLATSPGPITSPSLVLANPTAVAFAAPVQVTQISTETQTVRLTNPTSTPLPVTASVLGDFLLQNGCPVTLAANATCSLVLSFAPSQPGTRAGLLTVATIPGAALTYISLTGSATALLANTNGTLDLGTTTVLEPTVSWLQIQGSFPSLSVAASAPELALALLADDGSGHGTLPPSAFAKSASAACTQCWLAVQYTPTAPGPLTTTVQISSGAGQPYVLAISGYVTPATGLILEPGQLTLPPTPTGSTSSPLILTLTNLLPDSSVANIQQIAATGDFSVSQSATTAPVCADTLQPTASCAIKVTFTPTATGLRTGTLTVTTSSGTVRAALAAVGTSGTTAASSTGAPATGNLSLFPTQADFGKQATGTLSQLRQFTLTNKSSDTLSLTFAATRGFPVIQATSCASLAPAAACTFNVGFSPQSAGPLTGTITVTAAPQGATLGTQTVLYVHGYGSAAGKLTVAAGLDPTQPLNFGSITSGSTATQSLTLTNTGTTALHVRRLTSTTPFRLATNCTRAIDPAKSCNVDVTYAAANQVPDSSLQVSRTDRGTLLIEADADASPVTVYLAGTALPSAADPGSQATALPVYTLSQSAVTFPNTLPGSTSATQTVTLTNTGTVPVSVLGLLAPTAFTTATTCGTLAPQATCTILISFSPQPNSPNPSLDSVGILTDAATALDYISVLGPSSTAEYTLNPGSLSFASTAVGSSAKLTGTIRNTTNLPISLSASLSSGGDFTFAGGTCGTSAQLSLVAGQSCTYTVTFAPSSSGTRSATVTFTGDAPNSTQNLLLQGIGLAGMLQANPSQVDLGTAPLTTAVTSSVTLTNSGDAPLGSLEMTLTGANTADFTYSSSCPQAGLSPGASCTVALTFTPQALGPRTATLSVASTDPNSPLLIPLTGTGNQPPGFTLTVNGSSNASANITSGQTAQFPLTVTAQGGYTGTVTLTCTPIAPAPNATCSTADTSLKLDGTQSTSTASLGTLSGISSSALLPLLICPATLIFRRRRHPRKPRHLALVLLFATLSAALLATSGCGHGPGYTENPYTPPGTYQYQVTATATTGTPLSSSVSLTIAVH